MSGANGAPPEPPSAASTSSQKGAVQSSQAQPPPVTAALVRLYLARRELYRPWYPAIGRITISDSGAAIVGTSLPAEGKAASARICEAIRDTGLVDRAQVFYGEGIPRDCG